MPVTKFEEVGSDQRAVHGFGPVAKAWNTVFGWRAGIHKKPMRPCQYGGIRYKQREHPELGVSTAVKLFDIRNAFPSATNEAVEECTATDKQP